MNEVRAISIWRESCARENEISRRFKEDWGWMATEKDPEDDKAK